MSAPMTFPEHVMRWKDNVDANEMRFLLGKLYSSYFMMLILAFMMVLVIVNCLPRFNERRVIIAGLTLNLIALGSFLDI